MTDQVSITPRVFLARHGQTEWTKSGRYTGTTEMNLTDVGRQQVLGTSRVVVGTGKLIDPAKLGQVLVSPRNRAQQTFDLLFAEAQAKALTVDNKVKTANELAEWNYGAYEGLLTSEILARRRDQGLDQWNIWEDGCENGESAAEVAARLDTLIKHIRDVQAPNMHGETEKACDIVLISHGQ
ncbi:MAG: hypothetical protein LQ341_002153 [Variospora aurantia]|nr:MAG: hypothetical protein LQ341_002153 [Variospora aurantia]